MKTTFVNRTRDYFGYKKKPRKMKRTKKEKKRKNKWKQK